MWLDVWQISLLSERELWQQSGNTIIAPVAQVFVESVMDLLC